LDVLEELGSVSRDEVSPSSSESSEKCSSSDETGDILLHDVSESEESKSEDSELSGSSSIGSSDITS
jgi:hypothetical protein